jgi:hypothetical protein
MGSLSRMHFERIADALYWSTDNLDPVARANVVEAIGDVLAEFNGGFRRDLFEDRVKTGPYRWAVVESVPGYLPDSDPEHFETIREAQQFAKGLADELRESGYKVTGNQISGYQAHDPEKLHDLGRVVEIIDKAAL